MRSLKVDANLPKTIASTSPSATELERECFDGLLFLAGVGAQMADVS